MDRYKIVKLATEEATTLFLDNGFLWQRREPSLAVNGGENQHLYAIEPEATIEIGDWCMDMHNLQQSGIQWVESNWQKDNFNSHKNPNGKFVAKIVASTDSSLGLLTKLSENFEQ